MKKARTTTSPYTPPGEPDRVSFNGPRPWLWLGALAMVGLVYLVFKMFAMNPYLGDEHIYFYQAKAVSMGEAPYSDFPMAHPPIQAVFTGMLIKVFGYGFGWARLMPVLWCLLAGVLLALMVKREHGTVASIAAMALYLLAYEPLRASSHFTGVNMTTAILLGGYLASRTGHLAACAALCTAAVFTRLYAIPGVAVLVLWTLFSSPRRGLKLVLYGGIFAAGAVLVTGLWTGFAEMFHNMLAYHAAKTPMKPEQLANMKATVLFHNVVQAVFFALSVPALLLYMGRGWKRASKERRLNRRFVQAVTGENLGLPLLCVAAVMGFQGILLSMDRVWMYYFVPAFPFAAVGGGWLVSKLWSGAVQSAKRLVKKEGEPFSVSKGIAGVAAVLCMVGAFVFGHNLESRLKYYQRAMDKPPEDRVHHYDWTDGLLPGFVNDLVRATVWEGERTIGEPYSEFSYLLWHESRYLDILDEVTEEIQERTEDGDEIFGDSGSVPLFALVSGRNIAGHEADTNIQRYRSGNADPDELIERIDAGSTKLIIVRHRFGVFGLSELQQLLRKKYKMVRKFKTKQGRVFYMYERVGDAHG